MNALLKSSQVNEMEGGTLLGFELDGNGGGGQLGNETLSWDEATLCAPAFRVLKQMVQGCVADAVSSGNVFADALLQHLYRWLCRCLLIECTIRQILLVLLIIIFLFASVHHQRYDYTF